MIDGNTSSTCFASVNIFYAQLVREKGEERMPHACHLFDEFFFVLHL